MLASAVDASSSNVTSANEPVNVGNLMVCFYNNGASSHLITANIRIVFCCLVTNPEILTGGRAGDGERNPRQPVSLVIIYQKCTHNELNAFHMEETAY